MDIGSLNPKHNQRMMSEIELLRAQNAALRRSHTIQTKSIIAKEPLESKEFSANPDLDTHVESQRSTAELQTVVESLKCIVRYQKQHLKKLMCSSKSKTDMSQGKMHDFPEHPKSSRFGEEQNKESKLFPRDSELQSLHQDIICVCRERDALKRELEITQSHLQVNALDTDK